MHPAPCRYSDDIRSAPDTDICTCPGKKSYEPDPKPTKAPEEGQEVTRGLAQPVEIRGASLSSSGVQIENRPDVGAPNKVIGVVTSGDIAVYRDDVKSAIERGIAQRPDAVWVCLEPKSDRVTHDVMVGLGLAPVVLPMIDAWRVDRTHLRFVDWHSVWQGVDPDAWPKLKKTRETLYDGRRVWRDNELLHLCDELIVFHKRTSSSPWRERAASGLFDGRLFVVELGPAPKAKQRAKRKPIGA